MPPSGPKRHEGSIGKIEHLSYYTRLCGVTAKPRQDIYKPKGIITALYIGSVIFKQLKGRAERTEQQSTKAILFL
jgi:hypothetical protein